MGQIRRASICQIPPSQKSPWPIGILHVNPRHRSQVSTFLVQLGSEDSDFIGSPSTQEFFGTEKRQFLKIAL
jgi:hypothetical protein